MCDIRAAIYARVASVQQAEVHAIDDQLAVLRARAVEDGLVVPAERDFGDDGYSGATLLRPALERLRGLIADGGIDRLYVESTDRLARTYAHLELLLDELQAAGVEVVCVDHLRDAADGTPVSVALEPPSLERSAPHRIAQEVAHA
jgi:site-specific DNA recombinase